MSNQESMPVQPSKEQLAIIFYHGAYPLWKYLIAKFGFDLRDVCDKVAKEEPMVINGEKKLALRTVSKDYKCEVGSEYDDDKTFLLNCANVVFSMMKEGVIRHGDHILKPYKFVLDQNQNITLELESNPSDDIPFAKSLDDTISLGIVEVVDEEPPLRKRPRSEEPLTNRPRSDEIYHL